MQKKNGVSRRNFMQTTGSISTAAFLRLTAPALAAITTSACTAEQASAAFRVLDADEAATLAAIAARIIPTTDTPGATEAGVIHFFDNAFADAMRGQLDAARAGLTAFSAALTDTGNEQRFVQLSGEEQDAFLRTQEGSGFFALVRTMTIFGFFSMSSYGGNKNHVGWDLIDFEGHHGGWTYPFGYYDAEYATKNVHGE